MTSYSHANPNFLRRRTAKTDKSPCVGFVSTPVDQDSIGKVGHGSPELMGAHRETSHDDSSIGTRRPT